LRLTEVRQRASRGGQVVRRKRNVDSFFRTQVMQDGSIGEAARRALECQRVEAELEIVGRGFLAVCFVIDQDEFAALFKPQFYLSAQDGVVELEHEIEFAFDARGAGHT